MKRFLPMLAVCLYGGSAWAQGAPPPSEAQLQQAQMAMFQSEAQFFSLAAQRLQKQISEMTAEMAATKKYWDEYIGGKPGASKPPE